MRFFNCIRYKSILTNGKDNIDIQSSRFGCSITPPPGMVFSVINGNYYINGKRAWVEVVEEE